MAPTFVLHDGQIMQLTGRGPVPIDGNAMLDAIMSSHDACLRSNPAQVFHARKLRALHAELYELVHRKGAEIISLRRIG